MCMPALYQAEKRVYARSWAAVGGERAKPPSSATEEPALSDEHLLLFVGPL